MAAPYIVAYVMDKIGSTVAHGAEKVFSEMKNTHMTPGLFTSILSRPIRFGCGMSQSLCAAAGAPWAETAPLAVTRTVNIYSTLTTVATRSVTVTTLPIPLSLVHLAVVASPASRLFSPSELWFQFNLTLNDLLSRWATIQADTWLGLPFAQALILLFAALFVLQHIYTATNALHRFIEAKIRPVHPAVSQSPSLDSSKARILRMGVILGLAAGRAKKTETEALLRAQLMQWKDRIQKLSRDARDWEYQFNLTDRQYRELCEESADWTYERNDLLQTIRNRDAQIRGVQSDAQDLSESLQQARRSSELLNDRVKALEASGKSLQEEFARQSLARATRVQTTTPSKSSYADKATQTQSRPRSVKAGTQTEGADVSAQKGEKTAVPEKSEVASVGAGTNLQQQQQQPPPPKSPVQKKEEDGKVVAGRRLKQSFPNGWDLLPTSSDRFQCGLFAIIDSMKAQFPWATAPTLEQLREVVDHDQVFLQTMKAHEAFYNAKAWFSPDTLDMILERWCRRTKTAIFQVGCVAELERGKQLPPMLYRGGETAACPVVWIYLDSCLAGAEHYSGMKPKVSAVKQDSKSSQTLSTDQSSQTKTASGSQATTKTMTGQEAETKAEKSQSSSTTAAKGQQASDSGAVDEPSSEPKPAAVPQPERRKRASRSRKTSPGLAVKAPAVETVTAAATTTTEESPALEVPVAQPPVVKPSVAETPSSTPQSGSTFVLPVLGKKPGSWGVSSSAQPARQTKSERVVDTDAPSAETSASTPAQTPSSAPSSTPQPGSTFVLPVLGKKPGSWGVSSSAQPVGQTKSERVVETDTPTADDPSAAAPKPEPGQVLTLQVHGKKPGTWGVGNTSKGKKP